MLSDKLNRIYKLLYEHFGPQNWWPADSEFEVIIGAILTQNTNWKNVEKAIENLKSENCLTPEKINQLQTPELAELIRPAGYYKVKAKRLKNFIKFLFENYDGRLENLAPLSTSLLREQLLSIKGIGPETADSILLYALDREVFVVDTYTARIAIRHHLIEPQTDYNQLQELFQSNLTPEIKRFNEFHALLVQAGKNFCKTKPPCEQCPLNSLPHTINPLEF